MYNGNACTYASYKNGHEKKLMFDIKLFQKYYAILFESICIITVVVFAVQTLTVFLLVPYHFVF